jgi:hypothetical protein
MIMPRVTRPPDDHSTFWRGAAVLVVRRVGGKVAKLPIWALEVIVPKQVTAPGRLRHMLRVAWRSWWWDDLQLPEFGPSNVS